MALTCAPCEPIILRTTWKRLSSSMPIVNWHCRFSSTFFCCALDRRQPASPPLLCGVAHFSLSPCCCRQAPFFQVLLFFQVALRPFRRAPLWSSLSGCQAFSPQCDRPLDFFGAAGNGGAVAASS